eukprot:TRINITY_DN4968_c0_g1_i1.p1 TRINITY_DN4968_c0_g1~~TRINITY_DN4968_c0_g1_i1.p1  ORF type:complete len:375 (-),score=80.14 TRINITY_DN4968_c0_g1_i1:106-1230(-)
MNVSRSSEVQKDNGLEASSDDTEFLGDSVRGIFNDAVLKIQARFEAEIARLREENERFDRDRKELEDEKQQMANTLPLPKKVKLDVGGHYFSTSLDTLRNGKGMFAAMFSGRYNMEKNEEGCYFIDRDGTHFRHILNFLRNGTLLVPDDTFVQEELLIEAKYYQIPDLIVLLEQGHTGRNGEEKSLIDRPLSVPQHLICFDENRKHQDIRLTSNNMTATSTRDGWARVYADLSSLLSSNGQHYFEFKINELDENNMRIGITTAAQNKLSLSPGARPDIVLDCWGYLCVGGGKDYCGKKNLGDTLQYQTGSVVGILLDMSGKTKTVSFFVDDEHFTTRNIKLYDSHKNLALVVGFRTPSKVTLKTNSPIPPLPFD